MATPKLRFKAFGEDWNSIAIGKFLKVKSGLGFKAEEYTTEQEIRLLQIENVGYGTVKWTHNVKFVPNNYLELHKDLVLKEGDLVLALNRPVTNDQLKIAKLTKEDSPSILYQRVGKLDFLKEDFDRDFIFQIFQKDVKSYVLNSSIGSDQPFISTTDLYKHKLSIPSKEEQTKIASFLSAVDEKMNKLNQKHSLLSQYKQGMMQKLFSQQIRFKADDGSEFGEWEDIILDDVILGMQSGLSRQLKDEDTGLIVLRSNNVVDNKISYLDVKYWYLDDPQGANVKNYILEDGDILVNFINSMAQIGKSALYKKVLDREIICTTNILRVQANKLKIKAEFLNFIFQTNEYENYIQSITKPAVNQASFTTKEFKMMKFKLPCLEEQTKIANFLSTIDQKIEVVAQQIEQAKQWKKGLLQQMFV